MCHPEKVSFLRSYIHFISSRELSWIRKPTVAKLNQKTNNGNVVNLLHFPRLFFKITFHQTSCISSQFCFIFHWKKQTLSVRNSLIFPLPSWSSALICTHLLYLLSYYPNEEFLLLSKASTHLYFAAYPLSSSKGF